MDATTTWRGSVIGSCLLAGIIAATVLLGTAQGARAAEPAPPTISFTASVTVEQTVTVNETATVSGFVGTGEASATASATVEHTETAATNWEAYYWAYYRANEKATAQAKERADAEARPVAKERAQAQAQAMADEAARPKEFTATVSVEQTVTVRETAMVGAFVGTGEASATASATVEHTETAATNWEAYYWAYYRANEKATAQAKERADAEARPVAKERAQAQAQAMADEAARPKVFTYEATVEKSVTIRESFTIGDVVGRGEATVTATATESFTAGAASLWEAYYWAVIKATDMATKEAVADATAQARALALQRAEADARAQVTEEEASGGSDPDPAAGPSCGPQVLKADGTPWTCTFSEEFRGTELDRDVWVPQLTAKTGWQHAGECFVDQEDTIRVGDGVLRLTTRKSPEPFTCESPGGSYASRWTSGSLSTAGTFGQTYGRFEFRAKFPDVDVPGVHSALWMWPQDDDKYGLWPLSGEIDVAEVYSRDPDRAIPMLHYNALLGANGTGRTNNYCTLDPAEWNTYVAEWTRTGITISYGGEQCLKHEWGPLAPLVGSQPFDQPFMLALTQSIGGGDNAVTDATPEESTMMVDYVRAWS